MRERAEASAPARVCFGGESLDWMKNGPSIVGAVTLRTHASVEELPTIGSHAVVSFESKSPIPSHSLHGWKDAHWYTDPYLRFVESAFDIVRQPIQKSQSVAVTIESTIPAKAGVSSSAAVTLATIAAASAFFGIERSQEAICESAFQVEHVKLKTGAGRMDFYACGLGGLMYLNCGTLPVKTERYLFPEGMGILLADTLKPHETKSFISSKRRRFQESDPDMRWYADEAERMVEHMHSLLPNFETNSEEIGDLMSRFHTLLRDNVRCSTSLLDACVETSNKHGALGAKLTGSGMGGCMFALVDLEHLEEVQKALGQLPVCVYSTTIVEDGILINKMPITSDEK